MAKDGILSVKKFVQTSGRMAEDLKSLRANLEFCGSENRIIAVTSSVPGEGKSTVSFSLAAELAITRKKVLFIDADMRRSMFRENLGIREEENIGLSNFLSGKSKINDMLYRSDIPGLYIILAGNVPPNPAELLEHGNLDLLLKAVKDTFHYVIIDTPPTSGIIDSTIISRKCDGVILVVGSDMISSRMLSKVVQQLLRAGCNVLGTVLNKVKMSNRTLYGTYGSSKYYYGSYSSYSGYEVEALQDEEE
ncbi:MAG: CpsD/CapB family tyrosine-protein kinase [Clostridiales bacterium]|nr:CpsD/CapB family tyrosine-protein kinase [Clostridiales bacterium]